MFSAKGTRINCVSRGARKYSLQRTQTRLRGAAYKVVQIYYRSGQSPKPVFLKLLQTIRFYEMYPMQILIGQGNKRLRYLFRRNTLVFPGY